MPVGRIVQRRPTKTVCFEHQTWIALKQCLDLFRVTLPDLRGNIRR